MVNELERLRADLEAMERIGGLWVFSDAFRDEYHEQKGRIRDKIARLEAEQADPWREAKDAIPVHLESGGHRVKAVAQYAQHLTAKIEAQKKQIDCLHKEYDNRGLQISELVAENNRLEKRVAELEAEKASTQAVTRKVRYVKTVPLKPVDRSDEFDDVEDVADMQPLFEGPIVGIEPVLDPARVLATAADMAYRKADFEFAKQCCLQMSISEWNAAKPYPLKVDKNG